MKSTPFFSALRGKSTRLEDFFESGMEVSNSPFLTHSSHKWGRHLPLKAAIIASFFLLASFVANFFSFSGNLSALFLLLTYFFAGIPALISAIEDILAFKIDIDVLMTLAAFLSFLLGSGMEGGMLLVLFSFSGALEESVRTKATSALLTLKQLAPTKAWVIRKDGTLVEKSIKDIPLKAIIHVKAGQIIPLDGKVVAGISSINLVYLTGESLPQVKKVGDEVPAGGRNLDGALTIEVLRTSEDSTLSKIIQLIAKAQDAKPKLQQWLDKVTSRYALAIILLAFSFAVALPLFSGISFFGKEGSIYRSLAFLIAASPCALILAIPIAYLSAVSSCARQGILLKGGVTLDALAACKTIALDKTGTLTKGEFSCQGIYSFGTLNEEEGLKIAYGLERSATHPIAKAICQWADVKHFQAAHIHEFRLVPGYGVEGIYEGKKVKMGSLDFISPLISKKKQEQIRSYLNETQKKGEVHSFLCKEEEILLFRFKDTLRPKISETLSILKKKYSLKLMMLTGDHGDNARAISEEAGIDVYFAGLKPEDKLDHITRVAEKEHLAMIGDGINDAPALARATVGISMGKAGNTTAIDASDIVLLQDNIELLDWLFAKARKTVTIVRQNVFLAACAILLAILPTLMGLLPLWLAVLIHEGGTVIVGLNALRLLRRS